MRSAALLGQCWWFVWDDMGVHDGFVNDWSIGSSVRIAKIFLGGGILWVSFDRFLRLSGF
jgi:hypothetical protein